MMDVEALRAALVARGASWTAGLTGLSGLDPDRRRLLAGVPETTIEASLKQASTSLSVARASTAVPPASLDWRDNSGDWVSPVRQQDLCQSCVAFATCAVMESRIRIDADAPDLEVVLAPGPLFFCDHAAGCAVGRHASDIMGAARKGVGLERDAPYSVDDQTCKRAPPFARVTRVLSCAGDARARKFFVADEGPVYAEMRLFEDFYAYQGGVYRHLAGGSDGLHAVVVVGYDDARSCWVVKNSWGVDTQEDGFFRIGYGECEIDARPFIALEVERISGAPS